MVTQPTLEGMEQFAAREPGDRRGFIGGSDIAAIFGLSPWKSPYDLWEEKTATEYIAPEVESQREKLYRRGKKLEPWVIEMLEEEQGIYAVKRNQIYFDDEYPWMRCEVDFEFVGDDGDFRNGEIKTVSPFAAAEWGEQDTDEVPLYYALQTLHGLSVTRRKSTLVGALVGADDLRVYHVNRDEELIAEIRRRVLEFWNNYVIPCVPPPPQTASDTHKILAKYRGFVCSATSEVCESVRRLRGVKEAQKRLDAAQKRYELEVKEFLVVQAEALGAPANQEKFVVNGPDGKKLVTFAKQSRAGYTVQPTSFYVLRT